MNTSTIVTGFVTKGGNTGIIDLVNGMTVYHYFDNNGKHLRSERAWYMPQETMDLLGEDFVLPEIYAVYGLFGAIGRNAIDQITIFGGYVISYHSDNIVWGRKSPDFHVFEPYTDDM